MYQFFLTHPVVCNNKAFTETRAINSPAVLIIIYVLFYKRGDSGMPLSSAEAFTVKGMSLRRRYIR